MRTITPLLAVPVRAQEDTVEQLATAAEVAAVNATLAGIGCTAPEVEKEAASWYEIDDCACEIGRTTSRWTATSISFP